MTPTCIVDLPPPDEYDMDITPLDDDEVDYLIRLGLLSLTGLSLALALPVALLLTAM